MFLTTLPVTVYKLQLPFGISALHRKNNILKNDVFSTICLIVTCQSLTTCKQCVLVRGWREIWWWGEDWLYNVIMAHEAYDNSIWSDYTDNNNLPITRTSTTTTMRGTYRAHTSKLSPIRVWWDVKPYSTTTPTTDVSSTCPGCEYITLKQEHSIFEYKFNCKSYIDRLFWSKTCETQKLWIKSSNSAYCFMLTATWSITCSTQ